MKKITKTKIIILSFIFIFFSSVFSVVYAETAWQYEVKTLGTTRNNFKTLADCQADQTVFNKAKAYTIGDCTVYTLASTSNDPTLINNKNVQDQAVDVTPKINVAENKSIYKMLVPLPGITCMDSSGQDTTCISNDIGKYLNVIFSFAIGLCAALAVIMLIIAGVSYMGDESVFGKTEAKKKMFSAILGLIIALGAWALLNTINPALTGKGGLVIDTASVELTPTSGGGYFGVTIGSSSDSGPGGGANANVNVNTYDTYLKSASSKYGLQCNLLKAFMYAESGGRNGLTSPDGAQGLIQLMPGTFREQGVGSDPMDPQTNINAAASYLSKLKNNGCNGQSKSNVCDVSNIQFLAASYNGGPGANTPSKRPECPGKTYWNCPQTICNDNNKPDCFKETRIYAPRVEANFNKLTANGWGC